MCAASLFRLSLWGLRFRAAAAAQVLLAVARAQYPCVAFGGRPVVHVVQPLRKHVSLLRGLAAPLPRLRDGVDPVVRPSDGSRHACDGVSVSSQGQAEGHCPLQATVLLREALAGLHTVKRTEDGRGDRVECSDAIS